MHMLRTDLANKMRDAGSCVHKDSHLLRSWMNQPFKRINWINDSVIKSVTCRHLLAVLFLCLKCHLLFKSFKSNNSLCFIITDNNSPECRLYRWSIRIKHRYAVLKGPRERDIVWPPAPVQITPVTDHYRRFIREFNPASQEIWSGPRGSLLQGRPLLHGVVCYKLFLGDYGPQLPWDHWQDPPV